MTAPPARALALRSGCQVWVRPIEPADGPELRWAFEHLSEQSRYRRFFTGMPTLSDAMVRRLTEIDHVDEKVGSCRGRVEPDLIRVRGHRRHEVPDRIDHE